MNSTNLALLKYDFITNGVYFPSAFSLILPVCHAGTFHLKLEFFLEVYNFCAFVVKPQVCWRVAVQHYHTTFDSCIWNLLNIPTSFWVVSIFCIFISKKLIIVYIVFCYRSNCKDYICLCYATETCSLCYPSSLLVVPFQYWLFSL